VGCWARKDHLCEVAKKQGWNEDKMPVGMMTDGDKVNLRSFVGPERRSQVLTRSRF